MYINTVFSDDDDDEQPKRKKVSPEITSLLTKLYEALIKYKTRFDVCLISHYHFIIIKLIILMCCFCYELTHFSSGKELAAAFEQLPSRRELPDYYEIIEKPMDLNKVKRKIKDGKYHSVQDMGNDIRLLCANARVGFIHYTFILLTVLWILHTIMRSKVSSRNTTSMVLKSSTIQFYWKFYGLKYRVMSNRQPPQNPYSLQK